MGEARGTEARAPQHEAALLLYTYLQPYPKSRNRERVNLEAQVSRSQSNHSREEVVHDCHHMHLIFVVSNLSDNWGAYGTYRTHRQRTKYRRLSGVVDTMVASYGKLRLPVNNR